MVVEVRVIVLLVDVFIDGYILFFVIKVEEVGLIIFNKFFILRVGIGIVLKGLCGKGGIFIIIF